MSGVILLPTLNRVELLKTFCDSYKRTTSGNTALKILVDSDDFSRNDYSWLNVGELVNTGVHVSMGAKCRFAYEMYHKDYDWIGLLNDDHVCITPEWDNKVEALLDGTNMVSTNDGYWNFGTNVVGLTAWSTPLLEAANFPIFPHGIDHWFIDNVWKAIGDATGCWLETMKVNIEHRHVFRGMMPADETARISQNQEKANLAAKEFQKFMDQEFKGVCERILKLRESHQLKEKFT